MPFIAAASDAHPLDPLSPDELTQAAAIIRQHAESVYALGEEKPRLWFKFINLREPPKQQLVKYLNASRTSGKVALPTRKADALMSILTSQRKERFVEYEVSLTDNLVVSTNELRADQHPGMDAEEVILAEKKLLENPEFQAAIAELNFPEGATLCADPWTYGCDTEDDRPRLIPFMLYLSFSKHADSNHYAAPVPLTPTLRTDDWSLYELDYTPIYGGEDVRTIKDLIAEGKSYPWDHYRPSEYDAGLRADVQERDDFKPLEVVQREGPSFTVKGQQVDWQKWTFRVGFNYREGLTLHDVRYDGQDLFHRLSVSDMTVPYGDPRAPLHRKQAFDLGDAGAGNTANELSLGCDCLGLIHYFSANAITSTGGVLHQENVVCMHEQDEGIGLKHTNYRTNSPTVLRNRVLVVQQIITVANYEYIFAWKLDCMAGVHLETRATGILSTTAIMPGETSPYGTIVNPGVLATNHQHLFSIRIDPAIGALGEGNTIVQEDSVAMPFNAKSPPANNLYGVGYTVEKTTIETSGWADAAPEKNRIFKIVNPSRLNPVSGRPIGYKLVPAPSQLMLAHPDSIAYKRAEFGGHHIWVTQHRDGELFSGGTYTNQSNGNAGGILTWVGREDNVKDDDLVLWHTFGLTHNPRTEDWPVMPSETHMVSLKPADFFVSAPNLDLPRSNQSFNRSVAAAPAGHGFQGSAEVEQKSKESSCCQKK